MANTKDDMGATQITKEPAEEPKSEKKTLGDFEIERVLGKGGMGEVFLARQKSLDRLVALKVLSKEVGKKHGFVERFIREFRKRYGAERVTDDPIEAAYSQVHLFAKAVEKAGSTNVDAIRNAVRGLIYAAPGGLIRVDPRNLHTWKVARVGRILPDGQFKIVWSSEDPLPPLPWLPAKFLAIADESGNTMFRSISMMIELEIAGSQNGERKSLLIAMANVRGFLGDARTKFRSATAVRQPRNRLEFELAWREFEDRLDTLTRQQDLLTTPQGTAFEQFGAARSVYAANVTSMMSDLYPVEPTDNAPADREVVP